MIFSFLTYKLPIWYYNLKPKNDYAYFPTQEILESANITLEIDHNYISNEAKKRDLSYRAFQSGFISKKPQKGIDIWEDVKLPIEDEYRFIFTNHSKIWGMYILMIRLLSFKNPITEIKGFLKAKKTKRISYYSDHINYPEFQTFESELLKSNPLISIIIPTLNRYEYLKDVFEDYQKQTYKNFEIIVVDQSDNYNADFYKNWNLKIVLIRQEEKALWKARNQAIKGSNSDFILMSEDDIRIPEDFMENHIKVFDFFKADVSCGVFFPEGSTIPKERSYFKYGEQFATGNALLKKQIFKQVGLFDRQFEKQRMGDGEFGLRVYLNGYKLVSNPLAYCIDVKAPQGGLRIAGGSWDALRPKDFFAPRPIPSVLYLFRKYYGNRNAFEEGFKMTIYSFVPYKYKNIKKKRIIYILASVTVLLPLVIYAFTKSWNKASKMLRDTSKIEILN